MPKLVTTQSAAASRTSETVITGVPSRHRVPAHLARRFHQICVGITAEVTASAGLTPVEFSVLTALHDAPGIDQGTLADRLGLDPVTAHKLAGRLGEFGLLNRRVNPADRRARVLSLTPHGQKVHDDLRPRARIQGERILAPLAPEERTRFLDMLTQLVEAHEAYARPGNGRRRPPAAAALHASQEQPARTKRRRR
jgi:DNA-binding MarR family transcriptional regulator